MKLASLLRKETALRNAEQIFKNTRVEVENIVTAGEDVILSLYGASPSQWNLDDYQHTCLPKFITCNCMASNLSNQPPTQTAAQQHSNMVKQYTTAITVRCRKGYESM